MEQVLFIFDKAKCSYFTETYLFITVALPGLIHPKSVSGVKKRLGK